MLLVNIFAGLNRCDLLAGGIRRYLEGIGTNEGRSRNLVEKKDPNFLVAGRETLKDGQTRTLPVRRRILSIGAERVGSSNRKRVKCWASRRVRRRS